MMALHLLSMNNFQWVLKAMFWLVIYLLIHIWSLFVYFLYEYTNIPETYTYDTNINTI